MEIAYILTSIALDRYNISMEKNQGLDPKLVIKLWKEMLELYKSDPINNYYPSVRAVAEELGKRGYKTFRNMPPSREGVRLALKKTEEGASLLYSSSLRYWKGNRYSEEKYSLPTS